MSEQFTTVIRQLGSMKLLISSEISYETGQVVILADCYHAEIQSIIHTQKTNSGTIITLSKALAFNYAMPIYLGEWIEEEFFIQKNQQNHLALFYRYKHHAEILSSLINSLSVHLEANPGKALVQVKLGLQKSPDLVLETGIRAG